MMVPFLGIEIEAGPDALRPREVAALAHESS